MRNAKCSFILQAFISKTKKVVMEALAKSIVICVHKSQGCDFEG